MNFIVSAATDIGLTKSTNQDSYMVRTYGTKQGNVVVAVLCDGMGGLAKGEVASGSVVNAFANWADTRLSQLCNHEIVDADIRSNWVNIATEFNDKIKARAHAAGINIGTTLAALLLTEKRYYIISVGDTRVYEITDKARMLTKDQTLVAREVELGNITPEQAKSDSRRSVLLQCIGASENVYPDMFFGDTKLNAVYMLCSDGFRHEVSEEEIHQHLNPNAIIDVEGMERNNLALIELNKQRQERDNITVISIKTF